MYDIYNVKPCVDSSASKHLIVSVIICKFMLLFERQKVLKQIREDADPAAQRWLYKRLKAVNDDLGIPTESAEALGVAP